ncbi:ABC transporter transmembrane domain-containing protein [Labrenzia sp. C1B10]|uniref:ABC transporter transmembrane domain-containing protein n=1 Tax=Labrenzia sp. C1B10 TaxID=1397530 RepID=UPI0004B4209A|nr:ABC transporter transmembrane domain-containing protein [Labrenzia sp. C1B10]
MSAATHALTYDLLERDALRTMSRGVTTSVLVASVLINTLAVAIPMVALIVYDRVIPNNGLPTLGILLSAAILVVLVELFLRLSRLSIVNHAGAHLDHIYRSRIMQDVLSQHPSAAGNMPPKDLSMALASAKASREYKAMQLQAWVDLPFGLLFILAIALVGGWLALIPATACLIFTLFSIAMAIFQAHTANLLNQNESIRTAFAARLFNDMQTVRLQTSDLPLIDRFRQLETGRAGALRWYAFGGLFVRDFYAVFSQVLVGCVVFSGALSVLDGQLTFGGLAACTLLAGRALEPLQTGFQLIQLSRQKLAAEAAIRKILPAGRTKEVLHAPSPVSLWTKPPKVDIEGLTVRDRSNAHPLLRGIDLQIVGGEIVGLFGNRGEGKTCFCRTLLGLGHIEGCIRIGDITISNGNADEIRAQTTYIARKPNLPSGRVIDILAGGDSSNDADVRYLAHLIGVDNQIKRLLNGFDTEIRPAEGTIPTDVLQQLALVRGLSRKHKLIILDDATAVLDSETEKRVIQVLKMLKTQATILIVSDRQPLLSLASRVVRLSDYAHRTSAEQMESAR